MALVVLSPWPDGQTELQAAILCLQTALGGGTDERVQAIGSVAAELVQRYAPMAPQPIKNEAVIRCSGWLYQQPSAGIRSERTGDISTSYMAANTGALRYSGAMGLLSPFKIRRAGAI